MQIKSILKLLIIFFILLFITSFLLLFYEYHENNKIEPFETIVVEATVSNMQYTEIYRYAYPKTAESTKVLFRHYLVTLHYSDIYQTFDNQGLFESVCKGQTLYVKLHKEFDEKGKLIHQYLQL